MNVVGDSADTKTEKPCELCGQKTLLTRHHLIPRARHRNKRTQKRFLREEMQARILWVCRSCHKHIHKCFSEKELADTYHNKDRLQSHPEIKKFVAWISRKPSGFNAL